MALMRFLSLRGFVSLVVEKAVECWQISLQVPLFCSGHAAALTHAGISVTFINIKGAYIRSIVIWFKTPRPHDLSLKVLK